MDETLEETLIHIPRSKKVCLLGMFFNRVIGRWMQKSTRGYPELMHCGLFWSTEAS